MNSIAILKRFMRLLSCGLMFLVWPLAHAEEARPNILLIIADDLGMQLGVYGDDTVPTPNIDRIANEGVRFDRGYVTAASCSPSRGSIFTGLYPHQHGMYGLAHAGWDEEYDHQIHRNIKPLPNALKALGYRTAIYGKTHYEPKDIFDWDDASEGGAHLVQRDVRLMSRQVSKFIRKSEGEPFFVVASYVDPHRFGNVFTPFQRKGLPIDPLEIGSVPPLPGIGLSGEKIDEDAAGYYNMVKRLDYGIGLLLGQLEELDVLDSTLILLVSDNGPDFIRMKKSDYQAGIRVPFMARWPGKITAGLVRDEFVSTNDIYATFVSAAMGQLTPHGEGLPLQPLFEPGEPVWRDSMLSEFIVHAPSQFFPQYALTTDRYELVHNLEAGRRNPITVKTVFREWKAAEASEQDDDQYVQAYRRFDAPPEYELYDLQADPLQLNNLSDDGAYAAVLKDLQTRLHAWRVVTDDPFLSPEYLESMRERYRGVTPFVPVEP